MLMQIEAIKTTVCWIRISYALQDLHVTFKNIQRSSILQLQWSRFDSR